MSTITQSITALPTPPDPATDSSVNFSSKAQAFTVAQAAMGVELNTWAGQVNALVAGLNAIAAGSAMAISYTFSTTTTDSDPGAGALRLNNATQNLATVIRADLADAAGTDWTAALDTFDDSTSTVKGYLQLTKLNDASKMMLFTVSALATPAGYRNISVACLAYTAASPFANGDTVVLEFTRTGDKGAPGADGVVDATTLASSIHAATSKATPVDADEFAGVDSAASFALKKFTWANIKATLKAYFDTLYTAGVAAPTAVTFTTASQADVTIPGTVDSYLIVGSIKFSANTSLRVRMELGGSVDTGSNYTWHEGVPDQSASTYNGNNSTSDTAIEIYSNTGTAADRSVNFHLRVHNAASTALQKSLDWDGHAVGGGGGASFVRLLGGGKNSATTALTKLRFFPLSGTITGYLRIYPMSN